MCYFPNFMQESKLCKSSLNCSTWSKHTAVVPALVNYLLWLDPLCCRNGYLTEIISCVTAPECSFMSTYMFVLELTRWAYSWLQPCRVLAVGRISGSGSPCYIVHPGGAKIAYIIGKAIKLSLIMINILLPRHKIDLHTPSSITSMKPCSLSHLNYIHWWLLQYTGWLQGYFGSGNCSYTNQLCNWEKSNSERLQWLLVWLQM